MSATYDWIFCSAGGLLLLLAVFLLYWALLHDWIRNRGSRRCPKCWYDMSGMPDSLTCSECGHVAKRSRKLYKVRRAWRSAVLAMLMVALAYVVASQPRIKRSGWLSLIPTTALIVGLPLFERHTASNDWRGILCNELIVERLGLRQAIAPGIEPKVWDWQWRMLIDGALNRLRDQHVDEISYIDARRQIMQAALQCRALHRLGYVDPPIAESPFITVNVPQMWSAESEVPFKIDTIDPGATEVRTYVGSLVQPVSWKLLDLPQRLSFSPALHGTIQPPKGVTVFTVIVEVRWHVAIRDQWADMDHLLPIWIQYSPHNVTLVEYDVFAAADNSIDSLVRDSFHWSLEPRRPELHVHLNEDCIVQLPSIGNIARIELIHDDQVVFADTSEMHVCSTGTHRYKLDANFVLNGFAAQVASGLVDDDGNWSLRFSIDPFQVLAWAHFNRKWVGTSYWSGVIEQPIIWNSARNSLIEDAH